MEMTIYTRIAKKRSLYWTVLFIVPWLNEKNREDISICFACETIF